MRPSTAQFEDGPTVMLGDAESGVDVPTNTPTTVTADTRYARATEFEVTGRVAPGERVTFRAAAGNAWTTRRVRNPRTGKMETVRDHKAPATANELRQLRWRVHCGGELLVDQRPGQMGDSVTVPLPARLSGESVVVGAYNEEPLVNFFKPYWVEDPSLPGGKRAGQGGGLLEDVQQLAQMMGRQRRRDGRYETSGYIEDVFEHFTRLAPQYGCTTTLQQAHFFAQVRLETIDLTALREGISQPKAEHDYASTNGNAGAADAWGFIGRGILQTTGFSTYHDLFKDARHQDVTSHAELRALAPQVEQDVALATEAGLYFWRHKPCHDRAALDDMLGTSIRVNGWVRPPAANFIPNGYQRRVGYLGLIKNILGLVR